MLDGFGGSGSTLIAAEKVGRVSRLAEIDPLYCDTIIRRFETYTGKRAMLVGEMHGDQRQDQPEPMAYEDLADLRNIALPERPPEPALRKVVAKAQRRKGEGR